MTVSLVGIEAGVTGRGFMKARGVLGLGRVGIRGHLPPGHHERGVLRRRRREVGREWAGSSSVATAAFGNDANQEALTRTQEILINCL